LKNSLNFFICVSSLFFADYNTYRQVITVDVKNDRVICNFWIKIPGLGLHPGSGGIHNIEKQYGIWGGIDGDVFSKMLQNIKYRNWHSLTTTLFFADYNTYRQVITVDVKNDRVIL